MAILFLLLLILQTNALNPGQYTDYVWQTDYHPPPAPAAYPLNCSFFVPDPAVCASLPADEGAGAQAVLLGAIRSGMPEQDQDLVRQWDGSLPIGAYYESVPIGSGRNNETGALLADGAWGENGSLRNMWFRLLNLYPSAYDERDGHYYLNGQTLMQTYTRVKFVVPNPQDGAWCAQSYDIKGYDFALVESLDGYSTQGRILPVSQLLAEGEKANLTLSMEAVGEYSFSLSPFENNTNGGSGNSTACGPASLNHTIDTLSLTRTYPIKRYPDAFDYSHVIAIPASGFAQGLVRLKLPSDFLSYQLRVRGYTYSVGRNDLRLVSRGGLEPLLRLDIIPAPARGGTLDITRLSENDSNGIYEAEIRYKLPIVSPDIGPQECTFRMTTPFETKEVVNACEPTRSSGQIAMQIVQMQSGSGLVQALVTDPLGNPQQGVNVQFTALDGMWEQATNAQGLAQVWIPQQASMVPVEARLVGSMKVAEAQAMLFLPGKGQYAPGEKSLTDWLVAQAPILLILLMVSSLMLWLARRRSSAVLVLVLALAMLLPSAWAQNASLNDNTSLAVGNAGLGDLQATLDACQNYDFTNAVRHFGECAQSYQMA
ncbi:MAG: Ig-like domain-containing protein, partial [Candidatus Marsarchaeota archaeon]|nr:Ig-like domain-containing protein [Candidatus Marsarchaeota archaeon]